MPKELANTKTKVKITQKEFERKHKEFQKKFNKSMRGVHSFAEFLMSNVNVIEKFCVDSREGYCYGYINTNSGTSWDLRYGFRNFNEFKQYYETNVTNEYERLERLIKYGFHNCFSNTKCTTTIKHRELGNFEDYRDE